MGDDGVMTTSQDDEVRPVAPRPGPTPTALGRRIVRDVRTTASRRDLSVAAAELTYFAGIALVPWLLLGAWSLTWWPRAQDAAARLATTRALVPEAMGARPSFDALVAAGTSLGLLGALLTLLPATFYGEGVRRGCLSLLPVDDRFTGWRARLSLAPLLLLLPLVAWFLLEVAHRLVPLAPADGWGELTLRVVVGFVALWWALTLRWPGPTSPWRRAACRCSPRSWAGRRRRRSSPGSCTASSCS